jgi:Ras GTPase-activating-like protein IQGAP2/3
VTNKVKELNDVVTGNPLVIKMIVSFYRMKGSLAELLGSLIKSVIDDKNLHINLVSKFLVFAKLLRS